MITQTATSGPTTYPAAELDRRFYAFTVDRLLAWILYAGAIYVAFQQFFDDDRTWAGIGMIAGVVVVVGGAFAVLLGVAGVSPGKALAGLRVVHHETGAPIGVGRALLRTVILGIAALPTFCLGVATLAWTAVMDAGGWRRGWHDHVSKAVVVDIRPVPVDEPAEESRPRQIVNLTAMRLMPSLPEPLAAPTTPPRAAPKPMAPPPPTSAPPSSPPPRHRRPARHRRGRPRPPRGGGSPSTPARRSWSRDSRWSAGDPRHARASRSSTWCPSALPTCHSPRPMPSSRSCPTAPSW